MPNVTPLPSTLAAQAAAPGPYYGLVYLALAAAAYTDAANACQSSVVSDITNLIENTFAALPAADQTLPTTATTTTALEGSWKITWVPQYSPNDYANLMFAATFYDAQQQPVLMAVSIRGTDIFAGGDGLLQQLREDVTDGVLYNWSKIAALTPQELTPTRPIDIHLNEAKIATGSYGGLYDLMQFTAPYTLDANTAPSGSANIADYVSQFSAAWPQCPIIVTGHSLGGCQATVMAAYLKAQSPSSLILPNPFAPPTAGNVLFEQAWVSAFTVNGALQANIWINPDDLVPFAYEKVAKMTGLWGAYKWPSSPQGGGMGPAASSLQVTLIAAIIAAAIISNSDHYAQLPVNTDIVLTGVMPDWTTVLEPFMVANKLNVTAPYSDLWLGMMEWQHFPPCYYSLMTTQLASTLVYFAACANVQCGS